MANTNRSEAVNAFFSYAHEDEDLRNRLEEHLSILKRQGKLSTWHDRKIGAGREWAEVISQELESADIILLLISSSFLNSEYCYGVEMYRALKRHEQGDAIVIPIILRPVVWEGAPFGKLQALPSDAKPVTKWKNRDDAFKSIANGIAEAAESVLSKRDRLGAPIGINRDAQELGKQVVQQANRKDIGAVLRDMKFVLIQPGTFLMGSAGGSSNEKPVHEVTIRRPFYMCTHVVTQGEWRAVMGTEPWEGREFVEPGDHYPAVYVSWYDAKAFLAKLNSFDPENYYRLPTEEEWEYAARAGTTTQFSFGDDERLFNAYGWYKANAYDAEIRHSLEVSLKRPNPWGLYDMHGNVWEWVEDWYYDSYAEEPRLDTDEKVARGGGYDYSANGARSAFRNRAPAVRPSYVIGFRVVKEPL
jgi:formylglycine-generating enzyme required for sulfatase activity